MASCSSDYDWARNTQGMDPCTVASRLKDVCRQGPSLDPLSSGQSYPVPTAQDQTDCSCSSVVYNLVAACADCQHGKYGSWKGWSAHCTAPAVDYFPRPAPNGVSIPNWAYFDVGTEVPTYDPAFAKANSPSPSVKSTNVAPTTTQGQAATLATSNGNTPSIPNSTPNTSSSTATATITGTSTGSNTDGTDTDTSTGPNASTSTDGSTATDTNTSGGTGASGSQTTTSDDPRQSGNAAYSSDTLTGPGHSIVTIQPTGSTGQTSNTVSGGKKSNAGAVAGGVIGALLFLAIAGGILYWWILRRRRLRVAPSTAYIASYGPVRPDTSMSSTRALADRSNSVLDITLQANRDPYVPYRDDEEYRGNTLAPATSQAHYGQVSRASSLDHYRTS